MLVLESGGLTVLFLAKRLNYRAPESQAASLSQQIRMSLLLSGHYTFPMKKDPMKKDVKEKMFSPPL